MLAELWEALARTSRAERPATPDHRWLTKEGVMKSWKQSKRWMIALGLAACAAGTAACIDEVADETSASQEIINPGEAAEVVEAGAGETLTVTGGVKLGVLEGTFRIKVGGAWSTVGKGLYSNVTEASCVSPGRISAPPGRVLMSRTWHTHWTEWSTWN
jgi:hypothetical protein